MKIATRLRVVPQCLTRPTVGLCAAMFLMPLTFLAVAPGQAAAQNASRGAAWTMPEPSDLVQRAIRRIVTQDKPGGMRVADYPHRTFGHDETVAAVRAYVGRGATLAPDVFGAVQEWPNGRVTDALPCENSATLSPALAVSSTSATPVLATAAIGPATAATSGSAEGCTIPNSLWVAITKIERGDLPHELHVWYATRFRSDVQGTVQQSVYSFCERWLRVGGTWKYDGFVRVAKGVVAP